MTIDVRRRRRGGFGFDADRGRQPSALGLVELDDAFVDETTRQCDCRSCGPGRVDVAWDRIHLTEVDVKVEPIGGTPVDHAEAKVASEAVSGELTADLRVMKMVPGDEIGYQGSFSVRHGLPVHVSIEVRGRQLILEWVEIATLGWTSSVVSLPAD